MRFQKMVRTQLFIAGLGAALLFAVGTKAQEIVNTEFADGPYVRPMDNQAPAASVAPVEVQADSAAQQVDNGEEPSARLIWTGTVLIWIGAIGIYAGGPARRFAREIQSLSELYIPQGAGPDVLKIESFLNKESRS